MFSETNFKNATFQAVVRIYLSYFLLFQPIVFFPTLLKTEKAHFPLWSIGSGIFVGNVISDQAYALLGERQGDDVHVFQTPKRKSLPEALSDNQNFHLRNWMQAAGIKKHITFHSGRHTYATLLINNDTDMFTVSELLGHKSTRTSKRYARILNKKKRDSVDKIKIDRIE